MGCRVVHVDPMAISLKDCMLQRGGRFGRDWPKSAKW
jgi:hypothetical protein